MTVLGGPSAPVDFFAVVLPALDGPPSTGCEVCGKPLPELAVKHGDPFCSTRCARAFHGCALDPATERPQPKAKRAA